MVRLPLGVLLVQKFSIKHQTRILTGNRRGSAGKFSSNFPTQFFFYIRIRLDLVKHLMIKISERSFTLRFDDSMSSFSSENKIKVKLFYFHLKMMTWSHRNVV